MKRFAIPVLVLAALAGLAIWGALQKDRPQPAQTILCAEPVTGCAFTHRGVAAQLGFSAAPEPLKPFVITLSHPNLAEPSVSFRMAGMDMGYNRYDFRQGPDGNWHARITLPMCTASRADWIAELQLDGQLYALSFTTR